MTVIDDGHQLLRDISKCSVVTKDRTMSMDLEASVYSQNSVSLVASLSSPATKASSRPGLHNPRYSYTPLGGLHLFIVVCCRKQVCIPCLVETITNGVVYTHTWCRARRVADIRHVSSVPLIPPEIYANTYFLRDILEFKSAHLVYSFEVEESESKEQNFNIPTFY